MTWLTSGGKIVARSGSPAKRSSVRVDVSKSYMAEPVDPGEGKHLWTVLAMFRVNPVEGSQIYLDQENIATIQGPGCYKCEQPYTPERNAQPCTGSMG